MNNAINNHDKIYLLTRAISNSVWCSVCQTVNSSVEGFIHDSIFNTVRKTAYVAINNSIKSVAREVIKEMYNE
jgi:hypothetical protein